MKSLLLYFGLMVNFFDSISKFRNGLFPILMSVEDAFNLLFGLIAFLYSLSFKLLQIVDVFGPFYLLDPIQSAS